MLLVAKMHISQYLSACREFIDDRDGYQLAKCVSLSGNRIFNVDKGGRSEESLVAQHRLEAPIDEIVVAHLKVIRSLNKQRSYFVALQI